MPVFIYCSCLLSHLPLNDWLCDICCKSGELHTFLDVICWLTTLNMVIYPKTWDSHVVDMCMVGMLPMISCFKKIDKSSPSFLWSIIFYLHHWIWVSRFDAIPHVLNLPMQSIINSHQFLQLTLNVSFSEVLFVGVLHTFKRF